MKSITFVRHAKSSWEFQLPDQKRPLNKRGLFDSQFMSSLDIVKSVHPEAVFCSPAKRTRETCRAFIENAVFEESIVSYSDQLYDFSGAYLEAFIKEIDPKFSKVIIFGHNHALTAVVNQIGDTPIQNIPTCGIVKLNFNTHTWGSCSDGTLEFKLFPKNLVP
jgi:phosphohistidine phosphatase